jgi:hypothetical protein
LLLQLIAVLHLIQQLLLVLQLLALAVELLLKPLPQLMLALQHLPAAQALLVIGGQGLVDGEWIGLPWRFVCV